MKFNHRVLKATYCPNCGSNQVSGGITDNQWIAIVIVFFLLIIVPGIVLWAILRKANCRNCAYKWVPTEKTEQRGYLLNTGQITIPQPLPMALHVMEPPQPKTKSQITIIILTIILTIISITFITILLIFGNL